jgi:peptidoglycan/LPS O-acetylase OafA/YrhL
MLLLFVLAVPVVSFPSKEDSTFLTSIDMAARAPDLLQSSVGDEALSSRLGSDVVFRMDDAISTSSSGPSFVQMSRWTVKFSHSALYSGWSIPILALLFWYAGGLLVSHADGPEAAVLLRTPAATRKPRLIHFDGLRAFLALWVVFGHFIPEPSAGAGYDAIRTRGYVAVQFFIVLSGVVTHYAYGRKVEHSASELFITRLGSIYPTYVATVFINWAIRLQAFYPTWQANYTHEAIILVSHLTFIHPFLPCPLLQANELTPNGRCDSFDQLLGGTWTIATLAFAWMLYGPIRMRVNKLSSLGVDVLCCSCILISVAPVFAIVLNGNIIDRETFHFLYHSPPCRLFDFIHGVAVGESLLRKVEEIQRRERLQNDVTPRRNDAAAEAGGGAGAGTGGGLAARLAAAQAPEADMTRWYGCFSDLFFMIIIISTAVIGMRAPVREGFSEGLLIFIQQPIMGAFLYTSSACFLSGGTQAGYVSTFFATTTMQTVGSCSFQVYLWQWTFFYITSCIYNQSLKLFPREHMTNNGAWFKELPDTDMGIGYTMPTVLVLWCFSYLWMKRIDEPFRSYLKGPMKSRSKEGDSVRSSPRSDPSTP